MKKLILHIGISKTGTSSIQAFLTRNYDLLRHKGILYPMIKLKGESVATGSHNLVADSLLEKTSYLKLTADQLFHQFRNELEVNELDNIILSGEHFFTGHPRVWDVNDIDEFDKLYEKKVRKLSEFLKGYECYLVVYLRDQLSWFESTVAQNIRSEWLVGKRVYENDMQFAELLSPIMDYNKLLNKWIETIQFKRIYVKDFKKVIEEKGNVTKDFIDILHDITGKDIPQRYLDDKVNESWSYSIVQFKKELNKWKRGESLERGIIASLSKLNKSQQYYPYRVDSSVKSFVKDQFTSSNKKLMETLNVSLSETSKDFNKVDITYNKVKFYLILFFTPTLYIETIKSWVKKLLRDNFPSVHTKFHKFKLKKYLS